MNTIVFRTSFLEPNLGAALVKVEYILKNLFKDIQIFGLQVSGTALSSSWDANNNYSFQVNSITQKT